MNSSSDEYDLFDSENKKKKPKLAVSSILSIDNNNPIDIKKTSRKATQVFNYLY